MMLAWGHAFISAGVHSIDIFSFILTSECVTQPWLKRVAHEDSVGIVSIERRRRQLSKDRIHLSVQKSRTDPDVWCVVQLGYHMLSLHVDCILVDAC
jgi:hypothetical protein